ncbi:MAG: hypothetical protein M3015_08925 [Bacteroidota bacterium]|nr:hypothetical protein [Bacteroidota bacterium]
MKKVVIIALLFFILSQSFAQKKVSTYLFANYNKTIYDVTLGNNPSCIGLGLQAFLNTNSKFKFTIEITDDVYLEDDKVFRTTLNGEAPPDLGTMKNILIGSSFHPGRNIYISMVAGPSFIEGNTYFAVKPSVGFYFSDKQKWTGKISYINVFNRDAYSKDDFGSISFAVGIKLF